MENFKRRIGKKIREKRIELGFPNQGELAKKLSEEMGSDVDTSRVSRWESGENYPDAKFHAPLQKVLKSESDLLDITDAELQALNRAPETIGVMTVEQFQKAVTPIYQASFEKLMNIDGDDAEAKMRREIIQKLSFATSDQLKMILTGVNAAMRESDLVVAEKTITRHHKKPVSR